MSRFPRLSFFIGVRLSLFLLVLASVSCKTEAQKRCEANGGRIVQTDCWPERHCTPHYVQTGRIGNQELGFWTESCSTSVTCHNWHCEGATAEAAPR